MADREEIIEQINLYGLAMDTQRWALFDRIFDDDCILDYGPTSRWTNLADFKNDFGAFHEIFDATQHMMTNHLVVVDGDMAVSHTYGMWRLIRHAVAGSPLWDGSGYYDDRWLRTAHGWRIVQRVCRVVYWTGNPAVQSPGGEVAFKLDLASLRGDRDGADMGILQLIERRE